MAYEVEMKAWVDDWDAMERTLRSRTAFVREFRKEDQYFLVDAEYTGEASAESSAGRCAESRRSQRGFRLRVEGEGACVTFKRKRLHRQAEINVEREFRVDDGQAFIELMQRIGLEPEFAKVKEGLQFEFAGFVIELVHVRELGDFLEVEYVDDGSREHADDAAHEAAARRIEAFLHDCGVDPGRIETEPYMKLLRRARSAATSADRAP